MLIHNAYFWLPDDLSADDRDTFETEVKRLSRIPYVEHEFAGPPAMTEKRTVTDHFFDYATSLHFKTLADHEFYQQECQDHARSVATCKTFWKRVMIYDITPL